MPERSAIALEITPALFVAGGPVEGEVVLDFPLVQEEEIEEIVVKLRGSIRIYAEVNESHPTESADVIHENLSLWTRRPCLSATGYAYTTVREERFSALHDPVPPDPRGAELRHELHSGWRGEWGRKKQEMRVRKGIWGDYSTVKAELWIPHMDALPLFVPIPFTIKVTSITAPMKLKDTHPEKPIFPTVPQSAELSSSFGAQ
ncbi:hypothetical protein A0H81_14406 [Grifola frondosa]|uniref:Arrestin-like N-terminal domain-containing protein n=1 Tax=Grifola frondosa TaxID=5627 RepID=A0A1C7LLJ4_GRIFR|nr:hypothetical protein A0H81_14406 [Grifola frondosa]